LYLFDATADLLDHGTGDTGGLVVIAQHPPHAWDPLYGGQANLSPLSFPSSARTTGSNPKAVNELLWVFTILHPSSILPSISLPCQPLLVRNVLGFVEIRLRPIYESKSEIMIDFYRFGSLPKLAWCDKIETHRLAHILAASRSPVGPRAMRGFDLFV